MYEPDIYLTTLYYVNVLQPVDSRSLAKRLRKAAPHLKLARGSRALPLSRVLTGLQGAGLVHRRSGSFVISPKGLRRLAGFGVARSRDNNRLFFLRKLV